MPELKSFDRVAHCYDQTRAMPAAVTAQVADAIADALLTLGPRPRLIEVGIGTGRIAVPLAERGVAITGIDISPAMVALLREKRPDIGIIFAEASRPPLKPRSFDAALFVHILHLVPDPAATVRATLSLVRPGGFVIRGNEHRPAGSLDEKLGDILQETAREVLGIDLFARGRYEAGMTAFNAAVRDAGCTIDERCVATWARPLTGRKVQDSLLSRTNSGSWQIPDDRMQELHDALEPKISRLMGGMDVERPAESTFDLTIARLPGA